jgi:hypothetical protein
MQTAHDRKDGYVILDNGEAEGMNFSPKVLINIAFRIGANEIVVPDKMGDMSSTLAKMAQFTSTAKEFPQFTYGAVIQGNDWEQWQACLNRYTEQPWITALYLPRFMANVRGPLGRIQFLQHFEKHIRNRFTAGVHCLGSSRHQYEPRDLNYLGWVRGLDSSLPYSLGLQERPVDSVDYEAPEPSHRPYDYFDIAVLDPTQREYCKHNHEAFVSWTR